MSRNHRRS